MTTMIKERTTSDVYSYYQQALDLLDDSYPHYEELKLLLIQQVNDELHDFKTNSGTSRGTGKP